MQVLAKEITVNKLNYNTVKSRINIFIKSDVKQLILDFDEDFMPEDLDFLHDILIYENDLDIKLKNLPYCFFKNAEDHIDNTNTYNKVKALSCSACRYNSKCSGTWQEFLHRINPIKDLPDEVKIELTTRCNLDCPFCLNDRGPDTLTTEDVFSLLDQIKNMGVNAVRITGGEPLVRKDLLEILKYAKKINLYVLMNTNATLINDSNIGLFDYVDDVLVSVHSLHDMKNKVANLDRLIGLKHLFVRVCSVTLPNTIKNLDKFYEFFIEHPVDDWFLLRPMPNPQQEEPMTSNNVKELVDKMLELNKKYKRNLKVANAIPFCSYDMEKVSRVCVGGKNDSGHSRLIIDCHGNIKGGYFSKKVLGRVGNGGSLTDAWNSDYLRDIRTFEYLQEKCKGCDYLSKCKGGLKRDENYIDHLIPV